MEPRLAAMPLGRKIHLPKLPHTQPDTGHPYYLHRTRRGQVGTHTVLPQYL